MLIKSFRENVRLVTGVGAFIALSLVGLWEHRHTKPNEES